MYINLLVGIAVLIGAGLLVKSVVQKMRSPKSILREEMEERRKYEQRVKENIQRLRKRTTEKIQGVHNAVNEMVAALPENQHFLCKRDGDRLLLSLPQGAIHVYFQVADLSLAGSKSDFDIAAAQHEYFSVERVDADGHVIFVQEMATGDDAIRLIAKEIASVVQAG